MKTIKGISVCVGVAIGPVFLHQKTKMNIPSTHGEGLTKEWLRIEEAACQADKHLDSLCKKALATIGTQEAEIFDMHRLMLSDQDYLDAIKAKIENVNANAAYAVYHTGQEFSSFFATLDDPYMQARAADVQDVSTLLLEILLGIPKKQSLSVPSIVVAEDLTPSETILMDKSKLLAFVTQKGSENSHTAILARTMGIPSIVQADVSLCSTLAGVQMAVDGFEGVCYLTPDEPTLLQLAQKKKEQENYRLECEAVRGLPSVSKTGKSIQIFANIGSNEDIADVLNNDAEGIGLFRSEFLYLGRKSAPSEELQFAAYKNVAEKLGKKKVIIRTMDIGADKQVDYLGLAAEENPALGYRAIRICLDRPELFQAQLRAICRASLYGTIAIMFPWLALYGRCMNANRPCKKHKTTCGQKV